MNGSKFLQGLYVPEIGHCRFPSERDLVCGLHQETKPRGFPGCGPVDHQSLTYALTAICIGEVALRFGGEAMRPSGRDRPAVSERSSLARSRVVDGWYVERPHRPIPVRGLRSARSHGIRHRSCSVRRRFGACLRRRSGRKRLPARPSPRADSRRENKHWRWCRRRRRQCGACVEDEELLVRVEIVLVPINRQLAPCGKRRGKRSV